MGNEDNMPFETNEFVEVGVSLEEATYEGLAMVSSEGPVAEHALTEEDAVALERGIADMFEVLRSEIEIANDADADLDDAEPTVALLAELNRIWSQPLAA